MSNCVDGFFFDSKAFKDQKWRYRCKGQGLKGTAGKHQSYIKYDRIAWKSLHLLFKSNRLPFSFGLLIFGASLFSFSIFSWLVVTVLPQGCPTWKSFAYRKWYYIHLMWRFCSRSSTSFLLWSLLSFLFVDTTTSIFKQEMHMPSNKHLHLLTVDIPQ